MAIDLMAESKTEEIHSFNNDLCDRILYEFLTKTNLSNYFNFCNCKEGIDRLRSLKIYYIYTSKYLKLFFEILKTQEYSMKTEIIDAAFMLSKLPDPNKNKELIKKLIKSPAIKDISFDRKHNFKIYSKEYGEFIFQLASYYFRTNPNITSYIQNNKLPQECHNHTYFISKLFETLYSITSLCEFGFKGYTYHHSYTYDESENKIIDLCYNGVFDKDSYYKIFAPSELSIILNSEVNNELKITSNNTSQSNYRCELLKIALYKQYLQTIGYDGPFEEAPKLI